jgi:hypothetical protein
VEQIRTVADAEQLIQDLGRYGRFGSRFMEELIKDVPAAGTIGDHVSEAEAEVIAQRVSREVGISIELVNEIDGLDTEQRYALVQQAAGFLGRTSAGITTLMGVFC